MSDTQATRYWTREEVCDHYRISRSKLERMQRAGLIEPVRLGGSTRFPQSVIDALDERLLREGSV